DVWPHTGQQQVGWVEITSRTRAEAVMENWSICRSSDNASKWVTSINTLLPLMRKCNIRCLGLSEYTMRLSGSQKQTSGYSPKAVLNPFYLTEYGFSTGRFRYDTFCIE